MTARMKRVIFYFDVTPGMDMKYAAAFANPMTTKMPGTKRYQIVTEIPDPLEIDETVTGKATELPEEGEPT